MTTTDTSTGPRDRAVEDALDDLSGRLALLTFLRKHGDHFAWIGYDRAGRVLIPVESLDELANVDRYVTDAVPAVGERCDSDLYLGCTWRFGPCSIYAYVPREATPDVLADVLVDRAEDVACDREAVGL